MSQPPFYSIVSRSFPYTPTLKQSVFFQKIASFLEQERQNSIFVLKGFAGTGKTTLIATLVDNLPAINKKYVLLAPTGRAAKVIAGYSNKPAFTIHKKIYFPKKKNGGGVSYTLQQNKHKDTLFIVDEASMISNQTNDSKFYENGSLLDDLISYVYEGKNCKLLLLGDTAQLPPVNSELSPALDAETLERYYDKKVDSIELDEVMRQELDSGILYNATTLRNLLTDDYIDKISINLKGFKDIIRLVDGYEIQDAINQAYSDFSIEDTTFIVRSNKRANQYNQQIRSRILFKESELAVGDLLMVVKNNYFWLKEKDEAGFIANGDIIEVLELFSFIKLYGFSFAKVKIRMIDYPNQAPFETLLLLDTLESETPSLSYEQSMTLFEEVLKDYDYLPSKYQRMQKAKENEYLNALQVKFSYAITCHKSQGGQWNTVFIEQPYLPSGIDREYIRWLYTAVTRAKDKLYLIGFSEDDFEL
ncbi:ATP-dependent DNA helicase [Flavobacterium aciduliphilum]|uniref:Exodeoxyribonuclease-5 n=1 Tax=Flavobacterium aciduliphilum TaxID=1101402 RepID=A0A328Y7R1_9FLAO|nr:AAA family ATPase [Flavobacterium aciduliphilum]RAR70121.1 exodeoxyribonuclease-5 [Flavobacterium aciduliphilum]